MLPVNSEGVVCPENISKTLTKNTILVTIMHSNNEVGTLQPIREISNIIKKFNKKENVHCLFHSDAAQSIGIDWVAIKCLVLSIFSHFDFEMSNNYYLFSIKL